MAIFLAYGHAGHLDYQDAIAMEEAMREDAPAPCMASPGVAAELEPLSMPDVVPARCGTPSPAIARQPGGWPFEP